MLMRKNGANPRKGVACRGVSAVEWVVMRKGQAGIAKFIAVPVYNPIHPV
jgi:hypothetical protein